MGLFLRCLEDDLWPMTRETVLPLPCATMEPWCEALSLLSNFSLMLTNPDQSSVLKQEVVIGEGNKIQQP